MAGLDLDNLIIDRVYDMWFENKNLDVYAVLKQVQNFGINVTSETKDKTDATGTLMKRFYQAKNIEVTGENAVVSLNLLALQNGVVKKVGTDVVLPRILQIAKTESPYELPDTPEDGTLIVYGTAANGTIDTDLKYTKGDTAADGVYAIATVDGKTTITLPTDATDSVSIKYEYRVAEGKNAARVDIDSSSFPKECKATARILVSDQCNPEEAMVLYAVFPRFQMSPDFDWTLDTESTQPISATCFKDYCGKDQAMCYFAIAEDSTEYDAKIA